MYYILNDDRTISPCDVDEWARNFADYRRIEHSRFGDTVVSTVFFGLDHGFEEGGPPLLFETMIFGGKYHDTQFRCSTYEEAVHQHKVLCKLFEGRE